jgi:hypothetical protein
MIQATDKIIQLVQEAERESLLPTSMPEKVKKPRWHKQLKVHDKIKRRSMTLMKALKREGQQDKAEQPSEVPPKLPLDEDEDEDEDDAVPVQEDNDDDNSDDVMPIQDLAPPSSTAPPALGSKKRQRKHTAVYRETFRDSQDDPTAGIKRGKAGGLL